MMSNDDNKYQYETLFDNDNIVKYLKCDDVPLKTYNTEKIKSFSNGNDSQLLKALLDNGNIVEYWTCHETRLEVYDNQPDKFVYLGHGHVYEVAGVKQKIYPDIKYHFWGEAVLTHQ